MESGAISVTLTLAEMMAGGVIGLQRHAEALLAARPDAHGLDPSLGWHVHVEGALGELAFAKAVNRYWSCPVNTFRSGGDVGRVQVRTRSRAHYDLLVRPDADPADVYALVLGTAPRYTVVGWIYGREAKRAEWLHAYGGRPPAYFVPQGALHSCVSRG